MPYNRIIQAAGTQIYYRVVDSDVTDDDTKKDAIVIDKLQRYIDILQSTPTYTIVLTQRSNKALVDIQVWLASVDRDATAGNKDYIRSFSNLKKRLLVRWGEVR